MEKIVGDLADPEALAAGVAGADWVFNCAAKVGDWGTLEEFRRLNVEALRLLLDAAAAQARAIRPRQLARRLRGPRPLRHRRDGPPGGRFARCLHPVEGRGRGPGARVPCRARAPAAIVRPGFIYGERDRTVLPKLLLNLRRGRFAYFGSGDQALNCIYVKNLVHGIFLAAESPAAVGEVFNLTDGEPVTKQQFVGRVAELAGLKPPTRRNPAGPRQDPGQSWRRAQAPRRQEAPMVNKARYKFLGLNLDYSIAKARRVLGYQPPFTFEQAIEQAMAEHRPAASAAGRGRRGRVKRPLRLPAEKNQPQETSS